MARNKRGRCMSCEQRRTLYPDICRTCMDEEHETQRADSLNQVIIGAGVRSYREYAAGSEAPTDRMLTLAYEDGYLNEYLEQAYRAGFEAGAYARPGLEHRVDHEFD